MPQHSFEYVYVLLMHQEKFTLITLISQERETVVEVPKLRKDKCFRKEMIHIESFVELRETNRSRSSTIWPYIHVYVLP